MANRIDWTDEQFIFLESNRNTDRKKLTIEFNSKFSTDIKYTTIKGVMQRKGFYSDNKGRFEKGNKPWNTGLRGDCYFEKVCKEKVMEKMEKMHKKNRTAMIGDEYIYNGIPYIRVEAGKRTGKFGGVVRKRDYIWGKQHGKKPKGHCIVHLDGDRLNCDIENLICIPRKYMTLLMKNGWFSNNSKVTETAIKWCEHYYATIKDLK